MRRLSSLFVLAALLLATSVSAQRQVRLEPLPMDTAVRYGVLPNGLTYYVRHNAEPKGQAEFYIAQRVGSIQEEDHQLGLAHFLEHMCFNGTKHFPGKNLINYLETIGVQFGRNLNAYTSIDQTVYNISAVPVSREGIVDSCLLILRDWSNGLLLEDKEIDAERGVIHEEWRTGNASRRMYTALLPQLYPGSRYATCMPIGTMEVIDNFPYKALRDYYHTWYRPDLQAIIVVGDIDADRVAEKIRTSFADITLPADRKERIYLPVANNKEPIVAVTSDSENTSNTVYLAWKKEAMSREQKQTPAAYIESYTREAIAQMFNSRISEMMQKGAQPFMRASLHFGEFFVSSTKDAANLVMRYADGNFEKSLETVFAELLRATRYGFTESEYRRFRDDYLLSWDKHYAEREKRKSNSYVREYVNHFLQGDPMPGIDIEYDLCKGLATQVPLETINAIAARIVTDDNLVVAFMNTATEKAASRDEVLAVIDRVKNGSVEAYVDEVVDRPLLAAIPTAGRIVKEEDGMLGSRVLTLSNGVRVVMRATDFKADEISLSGFRKGGSWQFDDSEAEQTQWINSLHGVMGLGDFSATDLRKVVAGKMAGASANVKSNYDVVAGSSNVRDLETMLQLLTLQFAPQRIDEEAFASFCQRERQSLENQKADPMKSFSDTVKTIITSNPARLVFATPEMVDRIDLRRVKEMYDSRFDHADGFTFIVVGNIEGDSVKAKIAQYLGSLPVKGVEDKFVDRNMHLRPGMHQSVFEREMEMDRSTVYIVWGGSTEYNMRNNILMQMFVHALRNALLTKMREEAGATYSPGVGGNVSPYYYGDEAELIVSFQTNPGMRETLIRIAEEEVERIANEGIPADQLQKSQQLFVKNFTEGERQNGSMMSYLTNFYRYDRDLHTGYVEAVNAVTSDDVRLFARQLLDQHNRVLVSMSPKK
ncbi:MAG: insulinase family protein [Bacteroidaceae bacterium]|nr:insulinase family protein [Bacteroidaceae bacterium]